MTDVIVVVNAGSSSLKFGLYAAGSDTAEPLVTGKVTGIGRRPVLDARVEGDGVAATTPLNDIPIDATHEWITAQLLGRLANGYTRYKPVAAEHRVVHGGREFDAPIIIDATIRGKLEGFTPLAPLHQPHNIAAVDDITKVMPELPQVACFDTSFHRTQPRLAQLFALPRTLSDDGIIRYGFHGLSYGHL